MIMDKTLSVRFEKTGQAIRAVLTGDVTEDSDFSALASTSGTLFLDLAEVRRVFNEVAAIHVAQVRDVMLELRYGDAEPSWIESTQPALRSLRAMAGQMELTDLCGALDEFCVAVDGAVSGRARIDDAGKAELLRRYERLIEHYLALGAQRVLAFEPLYSAYAELRERWGVDPRVRLSNLALSNQSGYGELLVTQGDGQGSSLLAGAPAHDYQIVDRQVCELARYDVIAEGTGYNTLVVDVQGHELEVLQGFGAALLDFDYLNIECSEQPIYQGGACAQQIVDYLANLGYEQDSPICPHDDVMFIKQGKRLRDQRSPHPDFSCFLISRECYQTVGPFDEGIYCFCGDGDYHLRMHQAGIEAVSLPIPFFHESSGTMKYASPELQLQIADQAAVDRAYSAAKWGMSMGSDAYNQAFQ